MDPSQSFQNAASYLSSSPSLSKLSSTVKLEVYYSSPELDVLRPDKSDSCMAYSST